MKSNEEHINLEQRIADFRFRLRSHSADVYRETTALLTKHSDTLDAMSTIELELIAARASINVGRPADGLVHAEAALALANANESSRQSSLAYIEQGVCLFLMMRYQEAELSYQRGLSLAQRYGSIEDQSRFHVNLGNLYSRCDRHAEAIFEYETALVMTKQTGDVLIEAKVLTNISSFFGIILNDYSKAVEYCRMAIDKYASLNDVMGRGKAAANMGLYLSRIGEFEKSLHAHQQSLACKLVGSDAFETVLSYYHVVASLAFLGRLDDARSQLVLMKRFIGNENAREPELRYFDLADGVIRYCSGQVLESIELWKRVREWMMKVSIPEDLRLVSSYLAEAYEGRQEYGNAAEMLRFVHQYEDSVAQKRAADRLAYVAASYKLEQERGIAVIERLKNVELVEAIRRREELNRTKERYLALIAHELKEPLATVGTLASLLIHDDTLADADRVEFESALENVVGKMSTLVASLMSNQTPNDAESVYDVNDVWARASRSWTSRAAAKGIRLDFRSDDCNLPVECTEQQLLTIFDNVVSNAIKYSPPCSVVTIDIALIHDGGIAYAELSVKDSGPGINAEDQKKIFQPWQTLSSKPTGGESSTGLGLYFVKCEIDGLGGSIDLESALGLGTTFIVRLPLSSAASDSRSQVAA